MANIFAGSEELAKQNDVDLLSGKKQIRGIKAHYRLYNATSKKVA